MNLPSAEFALTGLIINNDLTMPKGHVTCRIGIPLENELGGGKRAPFYFSIPGRI